MKKILFVSGIQIFPPESGGQLRSANLCRSLALNHEVTIFSFTGRKKDYLNRELSSSTNISKNITEYVYRNPILGLIQWLFYKANLPPFWLTVLTSFFLPKFLKEKMQKADSILLDFPFLHPVGRKFQKSVRVNTHNAEFELYAHQKIISSLVKKIELESFKKAANIFFCSQRDRDQFKFDYPEIEAKTYIVPNGILMEQFKYNSIERSEIRRKHNIDENKKVLLFTGSRFLPNIHALEFLKNWAHEHQLFLKENNLLFLIAGTVSEATQDTDYLKIVGKVQEMTPYFWASDFGMNPVESGSGTNVKMIEFLAAKLPIITTTFGARGLKLTDEETCLFFDRKNLEETLKKVITHNLDTKEMANKAFIANRHNIDMNYVLSYLNISW